MRTVWFLAGGAAGVYATTKVRRAAEALTIDGIHDRLTGWFAGARVLHHEFLAGAAEKETELQDRLGIGPDEHDNVRALPASTARSSARHRGQLTGKVEE
jgi:Family of unknown function (DUF6167)